MKDLGLGSLVLNDSRKPSVPLSSVFVRPSWVSALNGWAGLLLRWRTSAPVASVSAHGSLAHSGPTLGLLSARFPPVCVCVWLNQGWAPVRPPCSVIEFYLVSQRAARHGTGNRVNILSTERQPRTRKQTGSGLYHRKTLNWEKMLLWGIERVVCRSSKTSFLLLKVCLRFQVNCLTWP